MKKYRLNKKRLLRGVLKVLFVLLLLLCVARILDIAPNYRNHDITDRTNVIINNKNVTAFLKKDIYIDAADDIYIAREDITNFFDSYLYYEESQDQFITTYDTKIACFKVHTNEIKVNGNERKTICTIIERNDTYYFPLEELLEIYNITMKYNQDTDILVIESQDRRQEIANAVKKVNVKSMPKVLSRTVEKIEPDQSVVIISQEDGWTKIRLSNGRIGYVKEKLLTNQAVEREDFEKGHSLGRVSLMWDGFSEYYRAPNREGTHMEGVNVVAPTFFSLERLGKGEIIDNAKEEGIRYIAWAKEQGYQVWAVFTNNSMIETTSEILHDYALREKTIESIVDLAIRYELNGINVDFENIYLDDRDLYTRFIIELYPRLKQYGVTLSVDVTAPDGGETWSLCFDRGNLAKNVDYMIFMAYDQHGANSEQAGSVAGFDWVELNLNKYLGKQEEVPKEKLILGIPFYTRVWKESQDGKLDSGILDMKNIDKVIPATVERKWDEVTRQEYVEYTVDNVLQKSWLENRRSVQEKLNLAKKKELAGVAFWNKDRESEDIWEILREYLESE